MAVQRYHCCYHCKDRVLGCHSSCETYQKEVAEANRINSKIANERAITNTINTLGSNRIKRRVRRDNWGR